MTIGQMNEKHLGSTLQEQVLSAIATLERRGDSYSDLVRQIR